MVYRDFKIFPPFLVANVPGEKSTKKEGAFFQRALLQGRRVCVNTCLKPSATHGKRNSRGLSILISEANFKIPRVIRKCVSLIQEHKERGDIKRSPYNMVLTT